MPVHLIQGLLSVGPSRTPSQTARRDVAPAGALQAVRLGPLFGPLGCFHDAAHPAARLGRRSEGFNPRSNFGVATSGRAGEGRRRAAARCRRCPALAVTLFRKGRSCPAARGPAGPAPAGSLMCAGGHLLAEGLCLKDEKNAKKTNNSHLLKKFETEN